MVISILITFSFCVVFGGLTIFNMSLGHPFWCLLDCLFLYLNGRWFWDKVQFLRFIIVMERVQKKFMMSLEKTMMVTYKDFQVLLSKEPIDPSMKDSV